jgi:hypothetical protein
MPEAKGFAVGGRPAAAFKADGIARKYPVPRLSILIPTLSDNQEFEYTLASVLQNRPEDCEVLVAHAFAYDDPYRLSGEVCFLPVPDAGQIVTLLNAGFEAACSRIVHVVQCGLEVEEGWTEDVEELFANSQVASVTPIVLDAASRSRVWSAGVGYSRWGRRFEHAAGRRLDERRSWQTGMIGPTLAAGFYRRSWWQRVRWDEKLGDEFADVHLNLTLAKLGATTQLAENSCLRSDGPPGLAVDEPYGFTAARRAEQLFWSHCGEQAGWGTAAWRAAFMLAEAVLALPSPRVLTGMAGRIAGLVGQANARQIRARIAEMADRVAAEQEAADASATLSLATARERRGAARTSHKRAA